MDHPGNLGSLGCSWSLGAGTEMGVVRAQQGVFGGRFSRTSHLLVVHLR
jgi:hypothetical protein